MRSSPASLCEPFESSRSPDFLPQVDVGRLPSADSILLGDNTEHAPDLFPLTGVGSTPLQQSSGRPSPLDLLLSEGSIELGAGEASTSLPSLPHASGSQQGQFPELLAARSLAVSYTHWPAAHARTRNLEARYCARLATNAVRSPLQSTCGSNHSQQPSSIMGKIMPLLAMFMESIPEQFIASQSISMLDGISRMPTTTFDTVKAAALAMGLSNHQLDLIQELDDKYLQKVTGLCINREASLAALQMTTPADILLPLSSPHRASSVAADMTRCTASFALQQEAYLHLIRTFVLTILTPRQCSLLCAAAWPFLMEFPSIIGHILEAAAAWSGSGTLRASGISGLRQPSMGRS